MSDQVKPDDITIRRALAGDVEGIIQVHTSSVRGVAASDYSEEVISEWSDAGDSNRLIKYREFLDSQDAAVFVAVVNGLIVGFSELVPRNHEVRAVYVSAHYARRGIGSQLLGAIESEAARRGIQELELSASINALDFYECRGYHAKEKSTHRLRSGLEMACYKMWKCITPIPGT